MLPRWAKKRNLYANNEQKNKTITYIVLNILAEKSYFLCLRT